jgi:hypothetical protein
MNKAKISMYNIPSCKRRGVVQNTNFSTKTYFLPVSRSRVSTETRLRQIETPRLTEYPLANKNINNMLKNNKKKVELLFYNQKYPQTKTYERKKIKYILLGFESIEPPCFLKRRRLFYVLNSTVF